MIDLMNDKEHARILELIAANTFPDKWTCLEVRGDILMRHVFADGITQPFLGGELYA